MLNLLDEIGQIELLILSQHIIDPFDIGDLAGFELSVTAGYDEDGMGVLPPDTMNHLPVLMVGSVRHGAGVDDAYIRRFTLFGTGMATGNQGFRQRTALRKIEFAP